MAYRPATPTLQPSSPQFQSSSPVLPDLGAHGRPRPLLLLPAMAMENVSAVPASPGGSAVCTPQNVKSTHWRTLVCPHPPQKVYLSRYRAALFSSSANSTPRSVSGAQTPVNSWPTPLVTPLATPVGTPRGTWRLESMPAPDAMLLRTTSAPEQGMATLPFYYNPGRSEMPCKALAFLSPRHASPLTSPSGQSIVHRSFFDTPTSPQGLGFGRRRMKSVNYVFPAVEEHEDEVRAQNSDPRSICIEDVEEKLKELTRNRSQDSLPSADRGADSCQELSPFTPVRPGPENCDALTPEEKCVQKSKSDGCTRSRKERFLTA